MTWKHLGIAITALARESTFLVAAGLGYRRPEAPPPVHTGEAAPR